MTPGEPKVTPDMLTAIERMAFDAYREGYMAGNEVSVTYEYESRVAHAEGRAARYVEARLDRFAALSTRVRELEAALTKDEQWLSERIRWLRKEANHGGDWKHLSARREESEYVLGRLRALLPQVPTNVGDGK